MVESIYAAALNAKGWKRVMADIARLTTSDVAVVYRLRRDGSEGECLWQHGLSDNAQREYAQWASRDALLQRVPDGVSAGTIFLNLHGDRESLVTSPYFREFLAKHKPLLATMAACIHSDETEYLLLCCHRSPEHPDFREEHAHVLDEVLPHMRRSIELQKRVTRAHWGSLSTDALAEALGRGLVLLDNTSRVISMNDRARRMVELGDALRITPNNQLRAPERATNVAIDAILTRARSNGSDPDAGSNGFLMIPRSRGVLPYAALFLDLPDGSSESTAPVTMVLISDPYHARVPPAVFRQLFGATPAEARIGVMLAHGSRANEISEELGISVATVRSHIRRLLEKSSARDQSELISIVLAVTR